MQEGYLIQLFDTDVAIPDRFAFVLEADVALGGTVLHGGLAQVEVDDLFGR
jgi:hypothetical protein